MHAYNINTYMYKLSWENFFHKAALIKKNIVLYYMLHFNWKMKYEAGNKTKL